MAVLSLALATGSARAQGAYYVDTANPAASDANPGTSLQPFKTITRALTVGSTAGTTINVLPGTYREIVKPLGSGTAGSPLVIRALGGPVIVDGSDDFSSAGSWALSSGSVWRAAGVTWYPYQVFVDGARTRARARPSPSRRPPGSRSRACSSMASRWELPAATRSRT